MDENFGVIDAGVAVIEGFAFLAGLVMLYFWLACAFLSGGIAQAKGRSGATWFLVGFFFGLFGLIAAAGMPMQREEIAMDERRREPRVRPQMREISTASYVR